MTLSDMRRRIDDLDRDLLRILNKRASIVKDIANAKKATGAPIHDAERVHFILERAKQLNSGPLPNEKVEKFFTAMLQIFEEFETET